MVIHRLRVVIATAGWLVMGVAGCPPPSSVTIYNNSGQTVNVLVNGRPTPWKVGTTFKIGDDEEVELGQLEWQYDAPNHPTFVLVVASSQGLKRYRLTSNGQLAGYALDEDGVVDGFLQLERDWRMFVVKAPPRYPVTNLPQQPAGWPLSPVCNCRCDAPASPQ